MRLWCMLHTQPVQSTFIIQRQIPQHASSTELERIASWVPVHAQATPLECIAQHLNQLHAVM